MKLAVLWAKNFGNFLMNIMNDIVLHKNYTNQKLLINMKVLCLTSREPLKACFYHFRIHWEFKQDENEKEFQYIQNVTSSFNPSFHQFLLSGCYKSKTTNQKLLGFLLLFILCLVFNFFESLIIISEYIGGLCICAYDGEKVFATGKQCG